MIAFTFTKKCILCIRVQKLLFVASPPQLPLYFPESDVDPALFSRAASLLFLSFLTCSEAIARAIGSCCYQFQPVRGRVVVYWAALWVSMNTHSVAWERACMSAPLAGGLLWMLLGLVGAGTPVRDPTRERLGLLGAKPLSVCYLNKNCIYNHVNVKRVCLTFCWKLVVNVWILSSNSLHQV